MFFLRLNTFLLSAKIEDWEPGCPLGSAFWISVDISALETRLFFLVTNLSHSFGRGYGLADLGYSYYLVNFT